MSNHAIKRIHIHIIPFNKNIKDLSDINEGAEDWDDQRQSRSPFPPRSEHQKSARNKGDIECWQKRFLLFRCTYEDHIVALNSMTLLIYSCICSV